ncbi:LysM peptidoglycan-binding domain-containing protein [Staphylococcus condimenti]|uniref:LysM peptidoglycan-binding domain-containing protein n=1 Tax=Staphylococcus condimenti TaxID=70255 RepID=UPI0019504F4F|nr:LysM domain-containing protein [Staphylococcus condimenti]QRP96857.1 LysM peptidoglycan-binding domain-containing protein [Staphylococcus condimenti]
MNFQSRTEGNEGTESNEETVIVQPGQTLSEIAESNGMTPEALAEVNDLNVNDVIYPGEKLYITEEASNTESNGSTEHMDKLPETGENDSMLGTSLFGGLALSLGALLLGTRRKKQN